MLPADQDYGSHIVFAQAILTQEHIPSYILAHPIFQLLLGGMVWISRSQINLWDATILLMTASNVLLSVILYQWWTDLRPALRFGLALSLPFLAPVSGLLFADGQLYFGYIGLANYHNPTVQLLKPWALLLFLLVSNAFVDAKNSPWKTIAAASLTLFTTWIKPNYTLALLPAIFLLGIWFYARKRPIHWRLLLFGCILPGAGSLATQMAIAYLIPEADPSGFILAPFQVEAAFSDHLLLKFLLSILFPLVVWCATDRQTRSNPVLQLAWIVFFISAAQLYLVAESGDRLYHGNFRWGAQTALLILFAVSIRPAFTRPGWTPRLAYGLHLASGILYYLACFFFAHYS